MTTAGNGTSIDTGAVSGFASKANGIHDQMQGLLKKTDAAVQDAISPSIWQGSASRQFDGVTAQYQQAQVKLRNHMQEILDSVNQGAQKFGSTETDAASGIAKAGASGNVNLS